MSEARTPPGGAPPPEKVEEHVQQTDKTSNLGAGDAEPDPATAENPPSDLKKGDEKREAN